jgi:probable rRNA maturation factor
MTVTIFFNTRPSPAVRKLAPLLKRAVLNAAVKKKGGISLVLTSDAEIRRLNKVFLARTGVTDVIAFNYPKPAVIPPGETPPFGDIFICLPAAHRQAKSMGHSLETELLILATHGALHLSGMDDATPALRRAMNRKTVRLLKKLL